MLTRNRAVFKPTGPKPTGPKPTGPKTTGPKKLAAQPGLADTLGRPRYEVLPLSGAEAQVTEHVPADATVTVTASVSKGMHATVGLATGLASQGRHVVPHLSARLISDEGELKDIMNELASAGVHEVFVVGGDAPTPVGDFAAAGDLLNAMDWLGHEFTVGITGYPETHPKIDDDAIIRAMADKQRHASYIVSQMCFDVDVLQSWVNRVRARGVTLPIYLGVPGPASVAHLLRISARIGVGASTRVLRHHGTGLLRLAQPGTWKPDPLLWSLAPMFAEPANGLAGLHIYTFNAIRATEQWRQELLHK